MPKVVQDKIKSRGLIFMPLTIVALLTMASGVVLVSEDTSAESGTSAGASVNVAVACTLSGSTTTHAVTINNSAYNNNITGTTLHTICNGSGNYNIYAVGYTNETEGNNTLYSSTSGTIPTGTTLDGSTSNWAMKLANSTGNTATIENSYDTFQIVPSTSTLVASYEASTASQTTDSTLQTMYGVSVGPNQPAGTYTGAVKYTMSYTEYRPPYMQDMTVAKLAELMPNVGDTTTLYDERDDTAYLIGKQPDGKYWMMDNLALDLTSSVVQGNISASNTHASAQSIACMLTGQYNGSACASPYATTALSVWNSSNTSNVYNQAKVNADYATTQASTRYGQGSGNIGVYYNYCAASAGSYCYASGAGTGDASEDVCPSGWRMPTGGDHDTGGEYEALAVAYGLTWDDDWYGYTDDDGSEGGMLYGLSLPFSGDFYSGQARSQGTYGNWWSSTRDDGNRMYYLNAGSDGISPTSNLGRYRGYSMRCLFGS